MFFEIFKWHKCVITVKIFDHVLWTFSNHVFYVLLPMPIVNAVGLDLPLWPLSLSSFVLQTQTLVEWVKSDLFSQCNNKWMLFIKGYQQQIFVEFINTRCAALQLNKILPILNRRTIENQYVHVQYVDMWIHGKHPVAHVH